MAILIEDHLPVVKYNGLTTNKAVDFSGSSSVLLPTITAQTITTLTSTTINNTGVLTAKSAATVPASAGAVAAGIPIQIFSDGPSIYVTSDAPGFSAVKGSICINTGGSSSSTRLYVNNGTTNWVAVTTAS